MGMGVIAMGGAPAVAVDPVVEEEAAAVGDPHMAMTSGESSDLCCESGVCKPCSASLTQASSIVEDRLREQRQQAVDSIKAKADMSIEEDDFGMGMGMMGMGMMGMGKMGMMGMG